MSIQIFDETSPANEQQKEQNQIKLISCIQTDGTLHESDYKASVDREDNQFSEISKLNGGRSVILMTNKGGNYVFVGYWNNGFRGNKSLKSIEVLGETFFDEVKTVSQKYNHPYCLQDFKIASPSGDMKVTRICRASKFNRDLVRIEGVGYDSYIYFCNWNDGVA